MYARLLALICLLYVSTGFCFSKSPSVPNAPLILYLRGEALSSSQVVDAMKQELRTLMGPAGWTVSWLVRQSQKAPQASTLAVLDLRGACTPQRRNQLLPQTTHSFPAIASTAIADGHILPFSWVDCDALNELLGPSFENTPVSKRAFLYGRAMARLLAHELYHVIAQTEEHTRDGIAKPEVTARELLSEHFDFERVAIAKLHPPIPEPEPGRTVSRAEPPSSEKPAVAFP